MNHTNSTQNSIKQEDTINRPLPLTHATRSYGRTTSQARPIKITPHAVKFAAGSALCEYGETKVLCTASVEDGVPHWMRQQKVPGGWLTAEYGMLPGSTADRSKRERQNVSGRTQEIQRLIGRSLRAIVDLRLLGERTITLDCDVIQADGGTRTASITGAYVALKIAIDKLIKDKKLKNNPLKDGVAAISVGLLEGTLLVDLDYAEDVRADVDFNIVTTQSGALLEVQGCAEKRSFSKEQLVQMLELSQNALVDVFAEQAFALE